MQARYFEQFKAVLFSSVEFSRLIILLTAAEEIVSTGKLAVSSIETKIAISIDEQNLTLFECCGHCGEYYSISSLQQALTLDLKLEDYKMLIRIYNSFGDYFSSMGRSKEAEYNYERALESFNVILENTHEEFRVNLCTVFIG